MEVSNPCLSEVVADECNCQICLEEFNADTKQPKLLPCSHSICKICLHELVIRSLHGNEIRCPFDQRPYTITNGNVNNVPNNIVILRLLDFSEGKMAKEAIKKAVEKGKKKIEELRTTEMKHEEEKSMTLAKLHEHCDEKIEHANKEKERLCRELKAAYKIKENTNPVLIQLQGTRNSVEQAERILKRDDPTELVERRDELVSEIETLSTTNIQTNNTRTLGSEATICFVPTCNANQLKGKLGEVNTPTVDDTEHGAIRAKIQSIWRYIWFVTLFLYFKVARVLKSQSFKVKLLKLRYYLFEAPEFRDFMQSQWIRPDHKPDFYIVMSLVLVHLAVLCMLRVLGLYAVTANLEIQVETKAQFILMVEAVIGLYLNFVLPYLFNNWPAWIFSLLFVLLAGYVSNVTAFLPVLSMTVMVLLTFASSEVYISHFGIKNGYRKNPPKSFTISVPLAVVVTLFYISSMTKDSFPLAEKTSALCIIMILPILVLRLLHGKFVHKDDQLHRHEDIVLMFSRGSVIVLFFAVITTCSASVKVPMPLVCAISIILITMMSISVLVQEPCERLNIGEAMRFLALFVVLPCTLSLYMYIYYKNFESVIAMRLPLTVLQSSILGLLMFDSSCLHQDNYHPEQDIVALIWVFLLTSGISIIIDHGNIYIMMVFYPMMVVSLVQRIIYGGINAPQIW